MVGLREAWSGCINLLFGKAILEADARAVIDLPAILPQVTANAGLRKSGCVRCLAGSAASRTRRISRLPLRVLRCAELLRVERQSLTLRRRDSHDHDDAPDAGGRRSLRPPDALLEPEECAVHLR